MSNHNDLIDYCYVDYVIINLQIITGALCTFKSEHLGLMVDLYTHWMY